jgi:hypothetical protein
MREKLRWNDPRSGREGFDERAGQEWSSGPHPSGTADSIPDTPWHQYKPGSQILKDYSQWAVTSFGLEVISSVQEQWEAYRIAAGSLLEMNHAHRVYLWPWRAAFESWVDFDAFEEAFRKAVEVHRLLANMEMLDRSFRRARLALDMRLYPSSLWENSQWTVTNFGLQVRSSHPERKKIWRIPAYSLLDSPYDNGKIYLWPLRAIEPWIEFNAFEEAFRKAIKEHSLSVDTKTLDESFGAARHAVDVLRRGIMLPRERPNTGRI